MSSACESWLISSFSYLLICLTNICAPLIGSHSIGTFRKSFGSQKASNSIICGTRMEWVEFQLFKLFCKLNFRNKWVSNWVGWVGGRRVAIRLVVALSKNFSSMEILFDEFSCGPDEAEGEYFNKRRRSFRSSLLRVASDKTLHSNIYSSFVSEYYHFNFFWSQTQKLYDFLGKLL